jgi:hypothetical protein
MDDAGLAFLPLPSGERVGVRGGCSPYCFIFAVIPAKAGIQ